LLSPVSLQAYSALIPDTILLQQTHLPDSLVHTALECWNLRCCCCALGDSCVIVNMCPQVPTIECAVRWLSKDVEPLKSTKSLSELHRSIARAFAALRLQAQNPTAWSVNILERQALAQGTITGTVVRRQQCMVPLSIQCAVPLSLHRFHHQFFAG
jgi:hypothetical protein